GTPGREATRAASPRRTGGSSEPNRLHCFGESSAYRFGGSVKSAPDRLPRPIGPSTRLTNAQCRKSGVVIALRTAEISEVGTLRAREVPGGERSAVEVDREQLGRGAHAHSVRSASWSSLGGSSPAAAREA